MKINFKDFHKQNTTVKKELDTIFGRFEKEEPTKETLSQLIERVNDWVEENNLKVLNMETLYGKNSTHYIEFIRVWYYEMVKLEFESMETQTQVDTQSVSTQTDTINASSTLLDLF